MSTHRNKVDVFSLIFIHHVPTKWRWIRNFAQTLLLYLSHFQNFFQSLKLFITFGFDFLHPLEDNVMKIEAMNMDFMNKHDFTAFHNGKRQIRAAWHGEMMLRSVVSNCVWVKVLLCYFVCVCVCVFRFVWKGQWSNRLNYWLVWRCSTVVLGWAHIVFNFFLFFIPIRLVCANSKRFSPMALSNKVQRYNHECLFWSSYPRICVCFSILCFSHIIFFVY